MAIFLVDSNVVVHAIKDRNPVLKRNVAEVMGHGHELGLSVISLHELQLGVLRSVNGETAAMKLGLFLQLVAHVWDIDREDALLAADVRSKLMRQGRMIGLFDILIAAQALRRNLTVATGNLREFHRVADLDCVDWTRS